MSKPVEFRFRISEFTPETLPMQRLGQYMLELAALLGEREHVHFVQVEEGSAVLVHQVEFPAVPKIRERLRTAALPDAPEDLVRHRTKLDEMLAADNATGELRESGSKGVVLKFRGRERIAEVIGPITEDGMIDGILVRIGGEDQTAHAHLVDGDKRQICVVSRDLARQLSPHLYGDKLRLTGRGRWRRSVEGQWELLEFRAHNFVVLSKSSLIETQDKMMGLNKRGWNWSDNPIEDILRIRRKG